MTTYNTGYPYSNLVATPPVANKPYELGARVRMAYGYILADVGAVYAATNIINITKLPLGAFIIAVLAKWADMSSDGSTLTLYKGTDAISAALDVTSAQSAYAYDYTGSGQLVETEAERIISATLGTGTLDSAITAKFECVILYAHD